MSEIYKTQTAMCTFLNQLKRIFKQSLSPLAPGHYSIQPVWTNIYKENKLLNLIPWEMALIFAQLLTLS